MTPAPTIEQGKVRHAAPLQHYWTNLRIPANEDFPRTGEVSLTDLITRLGSYAERTDAAMFVAREGDTVVGVADAEGDAEGTMNLVLTVHQKHRRRGIGKALLRAALAWAEQTPSLHRAQLQVLGDNEPARRLYDAHGFSPSGPPRQLLRRASREIWDQTMVRPLTAARS